MNRTHLPKNQRRVESESERKTREREDLAGHIDSMGETMPSCTGCKDKGIECVADPGNTRSEKCSACIRTKISCDVKVALEDRWDAQVPNESDWAKINKQLEKLDSEEEAAMAKILRARKLKAMLRKRRDEMGRRGVRYLADLDELKEKERKELEAYETREGLKQQRELCVVDQAGPSRLSAASFSSFEAY
jgi:hypothetical protein